MKSKEEVLDVFGTKFTEVYDVFFSLYKSAIENKYPSPNNAQISDTFNKLNAQDRQILLDILKENMNTVMFVFLTIFAESEHFKLMYIDDDIEYDLVDISYHLQAEFDRPGGWKDKFSKIS